MTDADATARTARPRRSRRWMAVFVVVAILDLLLVGYVASGYLAYDRLSAVVPRCAGGPYAGQTTADFDGGPAAPPDLDTAAYRFDDVSEVAFPSRDPALTIRGWFAPPAGADGPVVLLVHGYDSCRRDSKVLLPAGMLHRAGYGVLLIDLRNHGDSDSDGGRWAGGAKEYRDVLGGWDWLQGQGYAAERIGLFGVSLGAATATVATGEEPRVAATWADSSYADFATASAEYAETKGYPSWITGSAVPVGRALGATELGTRDPAYEVTRLAGRPIFIVHGLSDSTIRPHHAVDLASAAATGGTIVEPWLVPGQEHVEVMLHQPDRYEQRLLGFFGATIGAP